uniref:Vacuolar protein sorting-associated protein 13 n=1 Tax=Glossina brevipalpis TaxID=37001 RepID=A0A1A9WMW5_9MUSC
MVFESIVTDLINRFLGQFVENMDNKQLRIGIWSGDIVLHNLKVKDGALDEFELPINLLHGYLGKLVLKIPWKNLYSQPIVAQVEEVYLLISPRRMVKYNAEKEASAELSYKQKALRALDEAYRLEQQKATRKMDPTLVEKLTARIVNNVQVKVSNIHVRYEDTITAKLPFAFGFTLHNLEIFTTDESWEKCFITEVVSQVFKLAILDSIAVYMNCQALTFTSRTYQERVNLFRETIARKDMIPQYYTYVVGPISAMAQLRLNLNPAQDDPPFVIPKVRLDLEIEKLAIGITSTQFLNLMSLLDVLGRMLAGAPYRKFRPYNTPFKGNAKVWWKFAITSVMEEQVRKKQRVWSWKHIKEHRRIYKLYYKAHKERCLTSKPSPALLERCAEGEKHLDMFNLILIRKTVHLELERIKKEEDQKKEEKKKQGWFGGWFRKQSTDSPATLSLKKQFQSALTPEEREKLFDAIGYQEDTAPLILPDYYEAIVMNFKLNILEVGLYDDRDFNAHFSRDTITLHDAKSVLILRFLDVGASLKQRPGSKGLNMIVGMREIKVTGYNLVKKPPTLIVSKIGSSTNLLDLSFELKPLDKSCDQRIRLAMRPLQVMYDGGTILQLLKCFVPEPDVNLSKLEGAATLKLATFKNRSATGLKYMIESHARVDIDITLMPNIIILPMGGIFRPGKQSAVVVSLGKLHVSSQPHQHLGDELTTMDQEEIMETLMAKAYDIFKVTIDDLQILVPFAEENWERIIRRGSSARMHLLRPTSLIVNAEVCVVDNDPRLPKTRVNILLPVINLNLAEDRVIEAINIGLSIPLPPPKKAVTPPPKSPTKTTTPKTPASSALRRSVEERRSIRSTVEEEVIQCTNLELSFALKEFSITLLRAIPSPPRVSDTASSSDSTLYETPENEEIGPLDSIFYDAKDLMLIESPEADVNKLLSFQILQLEVQLAIRTFELSLKANLGAISLMSYVVLNKKENAIVLIETPGFTEGKPLLVVGLTMVNKATPDFVTKYQSVEQLINVNFAVLKVILHQEDILRLLEIAAELQEKMGEIGIKPKEQQETKARVSLVAPEDNLAARLSSLTEETRQMIETATPRMSLRAKVIDSIKLKLIANLEMVSLELTCEKRSLALISVSTLDANVILKSAYTEVKLFLKDIMVKDTNVFTKHPDFLSIVGHDALNCKIVLYNVEESKDYNKYDITLRVEVGGIKIVFVNWFLSSVLSFLANFQAAQKAIKDASKQAAVVAKKNVMTKEKISRIKMNLYVKAPVIIVPVDSQAKDAIVIDLGHLHIANTVSDVIEEEDKAEPLVLDDMKIALEDVRITRVQILDDNQKIFFQQKGEDEVDLSYGFKAGVNMMERSNINLNVKRNLTFGWVKSAPEIDVSGHVQLLEFRLLMDDYGVIMSIVNRNLKEGKNEFPRVEIEADHGPSTASNMTNVTVITQIPEEPVTKIVEPAKDVRKAVTVKRKRISEQLKFNIQVDGFVLHLMSHPTKGLARFGIYYLALKGSKLIDETFTTNVVLCNIQLDDTRPDTTSKITTYMCRKDWLTVDVPEKHVTTSHEIISHCLDHNTYMLDLTVLLKENETMVKAKISSFDIILCAKFLLKLTEFFKIPEIAEAVTPEKDKGVVTLHTTYTRESSMSVKSKKSLQKRQTFIEDTVTSKKPKSVVAFTEVTQPSGVTPPPPPAREGNLNVSLVIDEPSIILIESLDDMNTNAVIFNMQIQLNLRIVGERQLIKGTVDGLKMYLCCFLPERREATRHYILHPCVISLHGSTPAEGGLHISLLFTDVILNVSPAALEIFNKIGQSLSGQNVAKFIKKQTKSYEGIWKHKKFENDDYWFTEMEEGEDAISLLETKQSTEPAKSERCIIEMPCITLVVESGLGYYTHPLISVDTRLNAAAKDWSSNLNVSGGLTLSVNSYNQSLAVWEPVIEENEIFEKNGERVLQSWELTFNLSTEERVSDYDPTQIDRVQVIRIISTEMLEATISKTFIKLLASLGAAFGQAMATDGIFKPDVIAPYVCQNNTGFDITINFSVGIFTPHDCHLPTWPNHRTLNKPLLFTLLDQKRGFEERNFKSCVVPTGHKIYLRTKNLDVMSSVEEEEYNLYVRIANTENSLVLPLSKVVKRYFPLHRGNNLETWGIVSDVSSEYGCTTVNIHGVVKIANHFTIPINVFSFQTDIQEMLQIGTVPSAGVFHVPLQSIHTEGRYLHFAPESYEISKKSVKWDHFPTDLTYMRHISCEPKLTFEPFYININREKTEIYYELTNKYKIPSVYYTFHLRPPMYLRNALPINISVSVAGCARNRAISDSISERTYSSEASQRTQDTPKHSLPPTPLASPKPRQPSTSPPPSTHRPPASGREQLPRDVPKMMPSDDPTGRTRSVMQNTSPLTSTTVSTTETTQSSDISIVNPSVNPLHSFNFDDYSDDDMNLGEQEVEVGNLLHLPTIQKRGKSKYPGNYLVIRMIQYLEKDWSCTTEIPENHPQFTSWKFHSYDSESTMALDLYVRFDDRFGSLVITIFSPFWLVNKTGLMLSYKTDNESVDVLYHPSEYTGPILYAFRGKNLFEKKSCSIRVEGGDWSKQIPLHVAGSIGSLTCKYKSLPFQIGVHNSLTKNSLTKQITFIPYFTITNKCSYVLEVQEYSRPGDPWKKLPINQCTPWWPKNTSNLMLIAKVGGDRTTPFKYSEPIQTLLQLMDNRFGGINVDIHVTEGGTYINFFEYRHGDAPGLLINHTTKPVKYQEKKFGTEHTLHPEHQVLFTWGDSSGEKLLVFGENKVEYDLRKDGMGHLVLQNDTAAFWTSFLDGEQRILLFTEREEIAFRSETTALLQKITQSVEVKIHGIALSLINNEADVDILYLGITSSGIIWEAKKEKKWHYKALNMHDNALVEARYQQYLVDKAVVKAIEGPYSLDDKQTINFDEMILRKNNSNRFLRRIAQPGIWLALNASPYQVQLHLKVNRIQLDNQVVDCVFPVILAPIPPPKTLAKTVSFKPFIEASVIQKKMANTSVKQFVYLCALIQEFHVKVDLLFVMALVQMFASPQDDDAEAKFFKIDVENIEKPLSSIVLVQSQHEIKNFYDNLHLGPLKIHISFSLAGLEPSALPTVLSKFIQGVGVTLTDISDVVIRLAYFDRVGLYYTQSQLVHDIIRHYVGQTVKQFYVLVLGLDVLGNPYGLVVGFKKGVEDLFYEPFQGAVEGPGEFIEGMAIGMKSLFTHTVGGAAGALSKITGAMGKGLAVLTFDDEYQRKRRQIMVSKPKTFHEGMARSGKGLVMGFVEGVTGVVTKPVAGAREQGVGGFFKGVGKGAIGLVTRPASGVVDFTYGTFDSVKRCTEIQAESKRMRPPRYFYDDKVIRPYNVDDAKGAQLLREIEKGRYLKTDVFVASEEVVPGREFLVITNHRLLYVSRNDVFGTWPVQWTCLISELVSLAATDGGIEFTYRRDGKKKSFGSFSSKDYIAKTIIITRQARREKLLYAMEAQRALRAFD